MKRTLAVLAAASALALAPAANAAVTITGTNIQNVDPTNGSGGAFNVSFDDTFGATGVTPFTRFLNFISSVAGTLQVRVDAAGGSFAENNTNLTGVSLVQNGVTTNVPQVTPDPFESRGLAGYAVNAGQATALNIAGNTGTQTGGFSGSLAFVPNAVPGVPEPGTWAMMLLGFGALGMAMRRKQATTVRARIRFA